MKPWRRASGFLRDPSGTAAVEFALVAGPFILFVVGVIEVGRLVWAGHALDEVAISAARCIGIHAPGCAQDNVVVPAMATAFVQQTAQSWGLVLRPEDVSLAINAGCAVETGFLRVALSYSFYSVVPGLAGTELVAEACFPAQF